jgi:hypothetical protein
MAFLIESCRRVEKDSACDKPAPGIPNGGRDSRTRTGDTAHFRYCPVAAANEVQEKKRENTIEGCIAKWECANIANSECDVRVAIVLRRVLDVRGGEINALNAQISGALRESK